MRDLVSLRNKLANNEIAKQLKLGERVYPYLTSEEEDILYYIDSLFKELEYENR